jgi:Xaa-Pro dipeptidase
MLPGTGDFTPKEEICRRIDALKSGLAASGIDYGLIMQNVDLFYFTGSVQKGILVVFPDRDPLFFVQRSLVRARAETFLDIVPIGKEKDIGQYPGAVTLFKGRGAIEADVVPVAMAQKMAAIVGADGFADISCLIRDLRTIKSSYEIEQLKRSGALCDRAFARAREIIREGATEIEIEADLLADGRLGGHQGFLRMRGFNQEMMNLTVTSGFSGAIPSAGDVPISGMGVCTAIAAGSSHKPIERGIPVLIDYGGGYNGYITDETRSFVVGDMDELFRKPYEVARAIIEDIEAFGKAGTDVTEIFDRAYGRVKKAGLEAHFMGCGEGQVTFLGHGLGLEINELPVITGRHHTILKEGMVFAVEPKFVFPGKGVVGIEVDFIVRETGLERVTKTSYDLVQV